jgi:AcrR family transcriptional regulator
MPSEPKTGRGRASRERIVERAAELFAERGIAGTSLDEVLAAAGAGSRDELAAAAVGHRCAQVVSGLTGTLGGVSSMAALERALAGFVDDFERTGLAGCPIGSLSTEVSGRKGSPSGEVAYSTVASSHVT